MKKICLLFVFCSFQSLSAQDVIIQDQITKSPIKNVAVFSVDKSRSAISNNFGKVTLDVFNNNDTISFQHISYSPVKIPLDQISGGIFYLARKTTLLKEVLLRTNRKNSLEKIYKYYR